MSAPATQVYANDRNGNLWVLNPTTLANNTTSPYASPYSFPQGPANAGLAFENNTGSSSSYNLYLPGVYNGSTVQMEIFSAVNLSAATPIAMNSNSFRPIQAVYDGTGRIYVADYADSITAWSTSTFYQAPGFPVVPGTSPTPLTGGTGSIKAQGLAYNQTSNLLFTCYQDSSSGDHLAVLSNLTASSPTVTSYSLSTVSLASSYTGIATDTAGHVYITSNSPQQNGLTVLSSSYAPITGSPFNTGGLDSRGVCVGGGGGNNYLFVCNFGSNTLSVFSLSSSGVPTAITGSPFAAGPSPISVAYYPTGTGTGTIYIANFNGVASPITAYTFNYTTPTAPTLTAIVPSSPIYNTQFVNVVVGP